MNYPYSLYRVRTTLLSTLAQKNQSKRSAIAFKIDLTIVVRREPKKINSTSNYAVENISLKLEIFPREYLLNFVPGCTQKCVEQG